jgi:hypothetical protein
MKKLLFTSILMLCTIICIADSSSDSIIIAKMEQIVNIKEAELDSLDNIMPLADTVGETDTYCDMLDEHKAFTLCNTYKEKKEHFNNYIWLQSLVVATAIDWLNDEDNKLSFDK